MGNRLKELAVKISQNGGVFMFIRAQFSAQIATLCDFAATILLAELFQLYYVLCTLFGAILGGVINCIVNYKWTFKSKECRKRDIALKYAAVWVGSIALNTGGTYLLTEMLVKVPFIIPKLIVSLLVAFFWNYNMQRIFVYRNRDIKGFFGRKKENNEQSVNNRN